MKCVECGNDLKEGANFCGICGSKIEIQREEPKKQFCEKCGNELQENSQFCNLCGAKAGVQSEEPEKEEFMSSDHWNESETKEYSLIAKRKTVKWGFKGIPTTIRITDGKIETETAYKGLVLKRGIKKETFRAKNIQRISFQTRPILYMMDFIRIPLIAIFTPFSYGTAILPMLLFVYWTLSKHLVIWLKDGRKILIPICQANDAIPFLKDQNLYQEKFEKLEQKGIGMDKWIRRKSIAIWLFSIISYGVFIYGIEHYQETGVSFGTESIETVTDAPEVKEEEVKVDGEDEETAAECVELIGIICNEGGIEQLQLEDSSDEDLNTVYQGDGIYIMLDSYSRTNWFTISKNTYSLYGLYVGMTRAEMDSNIAENYPNLISTEVEGGGEEGRYLYFEDTELTGTIGAESVLLTCTMENGCIKELGYAQYFNNEGVMETEGSVDSTITKDDIYNYLLEQIAFTSENTGEIRETYIDEGTGENVAKTFLYNFSDYYINYVEFSVIQYDNKGQYLASTLYNFNDTIRNDFSFAEYGRTVVGHEGEVGGIEEALCVVDQNTKKYRTCIKQVWFDNGEVWVNPYYDTFLYLFEAAY